MKFRKWEDKPPPRLLQFALVPSSTADSGFISSDIKIDCTEALTSAHGSLEWKPLPNAEQHCSPSRYTEKERTTDTETPVREIVARLILALAAFLLSVYVSASEVDSVPAAKADTLKVSELSLEASPITPVQTEKHFLPVAEYQITSVGVGYFTFLQHIPVHTVEISALNNRGPPATAL